MSGLHSVITDAFDQLGLMVVERGWLSSNMVVFGEHGATPATVVDTGYSSHQDQSVDLIASALQGAPLGRVLNTHLHADHCGGNAALQDVYGCDIWVPAPSFDAVRHWDERALTFEMTEQVCRRFVARTALHANEDLHLGGRRWVAVSAPGHDLDALMLFQPESRVLISADALWENRVAINFPELCGHPGFAAARNALDTIERLAPRVVIPGHGQPFTGLSAALARSRSRLNEFEANPEKHRRHAERALTMFHMLEVRGCRREELVSWLDASPLLSSGHPNDAGALRSWAARVRHQPS